MYDTRLLSTDSATSSSVQKDGDLGGAAREECNDQNVRRPRVYFAFRILEVLEGYGTFSRSICESLASWLVISEESLRLGVLLSRV